MPPAARLGDPTAHGGAIVLGFPMVLIGGMPAARMGDMHVCPMLTPGVPPIPHVGGPILKGSPMVLIGGQPAAALGDMCTCVGPPATILMGCPTVMIGTGGSGSASGGGAGGGGAAAAVASGAAAQPSSMEASTQEKHWIAFEFKDKSGKPISGKNYAFKGPDGKVEYGILRPDGKVQRSGMAQEGKCEVVLQSAFNAKWSKTAAKAGDTVKLSVTTEGIDNGTRGVFQIWRRDISGPDVVVEQKELTVSGDKAEAEWKYPGPGETKPGRMTYSFPEFYFEALVVGCRARSGMLYFEDTLEIDVKDEQGKPLKNEEYIVTTPSGEIRKGKTDGSGKIKVEKLPGGACSVRFPNLPKFKV